MVLFSVRRNAATDLVNAHLIDRLHDCHDSQESEPWAPSLTYWRNLMSGAQDLTKLLKQSRTSVGCAHQENSAQRDNFDCHFSERKSWDARLRREVQFNVDPREQQIADFNGLPHQAGITADRVRKTPMDRRPQVRWYLPRFLVPK